MGIKKVEKENIDTAISKYLSKITEDIGFKKEITGYIKNKQEIINKFIASGKSEVEEPLYKLTVLRKWNSYTPVLPADNKSGSNKGGGYFLRIKDYGIVIDPGYNFIENFMNAGFKLDDIDSVFISHAHNDHTVELESIFSLLFKRNKDISETPIKKIDLFLNLGTFKKFSAYFDLSHPAENYYINKIIILNKHQALNINESVRVFVADVKHHEMISRDYAVGFIFEVLDEEQKVCTLNFTCDTGWSTELQNENKAQVISNLTKIGDDDGTIDVLIAHIGSIKEKEFDYQCSKTLDENEDSLYANHLGMIGCLAAIHTWRPDIVLLSEFGQEMNAIRHKIAKMFKETSNTDVVATDINFTLDLKSLKIMCFHDREYYPFNEISTIFKDGQLYYINESKLGPGAGPEVRDMLGKEIKVFNEKIQ